MMIASIPLTKTDEKIGVYQSTEQQMRFCYQCGMKHPPRSLSSSSNHDVQLPQNDGPKIRNDSKISNSGYKYVRDIPWKSDKACVFYLFPGKSFNAMQCNATEIFLCMTLQLFHKLALEIDRKTHIQMKLDDQNCTNGTAD